MFNEESHDLVEHVPEDNTNVLTGAVAGGVALIVAGCAWASFHLGRNSGARQSKLIAWRQAGNKKKRLQTFGKSEYEYLSELFEDEGEYDYDENGELVSCNGAVDDVTTKKKKKKRKGF
jgi:hypothetical protein